MRVRIDCWNCDEPSLREIVAGSDPKCRRCRKRLLAEPYDGRDLPGNAHPEPLVEPIETGRSSPRRHHCSFCGSGEEPALDDRMSGAVWANIAVMTLSGIMCFVPMPSYLAVLSVAVFAMTVVAQILCWSGVLFRSRSYYCPNCDSILP
jgi:hypothetical protein